MNMRYGFEREYFVTKHGDFSLCPTNVPMDGCGFLAESRGEPHNNPMSAAFLMLSEESRIKKLAKGCQLLPLAFADVPKTILREAIRLYGKASLSHEQGNIYGLDYEADDELVRAGLHVHFSNLLKVPTKDGQFVEVPQMIDFVKIIQRLDAAFEDEIKAAKRIPGLYELKGHGFEYRSLPASMEPRKVATVIQSFNL